MRRLRFVRDAGSAPAAEADTTVIVLDVAWTPTPRSRADVVPIRPVFGAVTARYDLFDTALEFLDGWADEAGIAERAMVGDVTYWFRVREMMWRWLHERLLWRYVVAELGGLDEPIELVIDADEPALVDVGTALGVLASRAAPEPSAASSPVSRVVARLRRLAAATPARPAPPAPPPLPARDAHAAFFDDRFDRLAAETGPRVVVLSTPTTFQRVATANVPRDPILGSVVDALEDLGVRMVRVAIGPDHRRDADRGALEADDRALPLSWFRARWGRPDDAARADAASAAIDAAVETAARPVVVDGLDLTAAFISELRHQFGRIVSIDVRHRALIDRFLTELRPDAILLAQEGIRVPWLAAGHDRRVPVFAVQHGILYLGHPGYPHRRHAAVRRPTTTFVFGSYERDMLLSRGAYLAEEVVVGGSPRLDLDRGEGEPAVDERETIRAQLGVHPAHRLLVVSTVNLPVLQRAHLAPMLERLLGGPLPNTHVAFKLHPGERDDGPYRGILDGLAAAGGYQAPPISVHRDIDLLALLRAADAHLGLHSTVLTDAVAAGTMNLIAMTDAHTDILGYVDAGVAVPVRSREDVLAALASPSRPSADARRAFLERHFEPGKAGSRIARSIAAVIGIASEPMVGTRP